MKGEVERENGKSVALIGSAVLFLLSWFWMLESYRTIEVDFSVTDIAIILCVVLVVVALQIATIAGSFIVTKGPLAPTLLCALFIVLNAFSLNLIMNASFMARHPAIIAGMLLVGVFVAYTIVKMTTEARVLRRPILAALALLAASPAVAAFLPGSWGSTTANPSQVVRNVDFVTRPNVYFIGFESMAPQTVLSKYLGYDDSPLLATMRRHDFRVFRNLFAERVPTKAALTALLALERDYYVQAVRAGYPLLSGNMASPLIDVFKHNGYETSTLYHRAYFGAKSGPHVDNYRVNVAFSVCSFMEPREVAYAFFGACQLNDRVGWKDDGTVPGGQIDFLIHEMEAIVKQSRPQFLLAHHGPPRHTPKSFTGSEAEIGQFRGRYHEASVQAAANLDRLMAFLEQNDPEALLFIFGDHGIWLSRTVSFAEDSMFFVQDRHAVAGGIYPSDACAESLDAPISPDFVTVPQAARMIIRCLSGGVDAFDPSYEHTLVAGGGHTGYEDYLYE